MSDWLFILLLGGLAAYALYAVVNWIRYRLACKQRAKLNKWQRRALIDAEPRGFPLSEVQKNQAEQ